MARKPTAASTQIPAFAEDVQTDDEEGDYEDDEGDAEADADGDDDIDGDGNADGDVGDEEEEEVAPKSVAAKRPVAPGKPAAAVAAIPRSGIKPLAPAAAASATAKPQATTTTAAAATTGGAKRKAVDQGPVPTVSAAEWAAKQQQQQQKQGPSVPAIVVDGPKQDPHSVRVEHKNQESAYVNGATYVITEAVDTTLAAGSSMEIKCRKGSHPQIIVVTAVFDAEANRTVAQYAIKPKEQAPRSRAKKPVDAIAAAAAALAGQSTDAGAATQTENGQPAKRARTAAGSSVNTQETLASLCEVIGGLLPIAKHAGIALSFTISLEGAAARTRAAPASAPALAVAES